MKYWFDTEFIEDGKTIDLISIGIVAEDEREFYRQSLEFDASKASVWVRQNVLSHLIHFEMSRKDIATPSFYTACALNDCKGECGWVLRNQMKRDILAFVGDDPKPQFWAYYADYDWVVFCQLFGTMMDLPKGWPMYCRDIKQWCDMLGNPKLPEQGKGEHHALADARWNRQAWEFLANLTPPTEQPKGE